MLINVFIYTEFVINLLKHRKIPTITRFTKIAVLQTSVTGMSHISPNQHQDARSSSKQELTMNYLLSFNMTSCGNIEKRLSKLDRVQQKCSVE